MIPSTEKQTKYYKESKLQSIPLMSIDGKILKPYKIHFKIFMKISIHLKNKLEYLPGRGGTMVTKVVFPWGGSSITFGCAELYNFSQLWKTQLHKLSKLILSVTEIPDVETKSCRRSVTNRT